MVNNISKDPSVINNHSMESGHSAHFSSESSTPNAKTTEIYNQSVNAPKDENKPEKKLVGNAAPENPVEVTPEMLDDLAAALQYGLPIADIIGKAPSIINTELNNGMLPLHFAIHYGEKDAIEFLLVRTDLQLKDANGFDTFDHAVQAGNDALAKNIMLGNMKNEWTLVQKSCENVQVVHEENPALHALLKDYPEEVLPRVIENLKNNVSNGGSTHNSLLVRSIATSDYQAFLRAIMAGADVRTQDPQTGETLLHLAMKAGQEEIIYFLLDSAPGLHLAPDLQGVTPLKIAEEAKKQHLVDLIHYLSHARTLKVIDTNLEVLKKSETELQVKLEPLEKNHLEIVSDLAVLEKNKIGMETQLAILEKNKTDAMADLKKLTKFNDDLASLESAKMKANSAIERKLAALEENEVMIKAEIETLKKYNSSLSSFLGFFSPQIKKDKAETVLKLQALQKNSTKLESEFETLQKNRITVEVAIGRLKGNNPNIEAQLQKLQKNIVEIEIQYGLLNTSKNEMQAELDSLIKDKTEMEGELEALQKNTAEVKMAVDSLDKTKSEIEPKLEVLKKIPGIEQKSESLNKNVNDYVEAFKAKVETLSNEEKLQLHFVAQHGIVDHPEGSQGHNKLVLGSIINQDLEQLVLLTSLGATLDSTSVPAARAIEDPMGYGAIFRGVQESNTEKVRGLKDAVWKDPTGPQAPGQGKSLLDMAVYYAKDGEGEQKSLEIIAYLLGLGLDPMRVNDEGESPFSTALLKGNYKAALLMIKDLEFVDTLVDRTYLLLKEGSKLRDPLAVSSSKATSAFFAAAYLMTSVYAGNSVLSYINLIPLVMSVFSGLASGGSSYREKLTAKSVEPIYYPEIVKKAYPYVAKASILEFAAMPQNPIGLMSMTAVGVYSSAVETFRSIKTAANYVADRPLSAAYKVVVDALPLASNAVRFKTMFSNMFFPQASVATKPVKKPECKAVNADDYKNMTTVERVSDMNLDPACRKHAKILLSADWDDKQFLAAKQDTYVNRLYRKGVLNVHPDKGGDKVVFDRFSQARDTLLPPDELPGELMIAPPDAPFSLTSTVSSLATNGVVWDTAIKMGIVVGTSTETFEKNVPGAKYFWPTMSFGSMGYWVCKGVHGAAQSAYRAVVG